MMNRLVRLSICVILFASTAWSQILPGPAFSISNDTVLDETTLVAAGSRSSFAVAWGQLGTLRVRFMRADGLPLTDVIVLGEADDVSIASDGDGFLVLYSRFQQIRAIRFSSAGERIDPVPILVSSVATATPVHVESTGRGSWQLFWSEGTSVRTAALDDGELDAPVPVVTHAEPLFDLQAQLHPITGIWLITVTTEVACRITCAPSLASTVYATLIPGTAVDIAEFEGGAQTPQLLVLRDGRIAAGAGDGAIGWRFEELELVPYWLITHDEPACGTALVEHGSEMLVFTSTCQTNALFVQPVSQRGALGVRLPIDAAVDGFPIATFRTLRGAGVVYVGNPANPTIVGRIMPSILRRGVSRP